MLRGVAGCSSDNAKIQEYLKWEPDTCLRDGMEKTYRWIFDEFTAKYNAKTAHKSSISTFTKGSHPIPGDGYNPESRYADTWTQGIPAGYGKAGPKAKAKSAAKAQKAKKAAARTTKSGKKVAKKALRRKNYRTTSSVPKPTAYRDRGRPFFPAAKVGAHSPAIRN